MGRVYCVPVLLALLLFVAVRVADACVAGGLTTGCLCDAGADCTAVWFSCRNDGTDQLGNLGLAFTYNQPQRSDPGYRWFIANGAGSPVYPGQTSYNPVMNYLPYDRTSTPNPGSNWDMPQWRTMGINGLSDSNPIANGLWACTDDALLTRNLNGGAGPLQPKCQYGTAPAFPVTLDLSTCTQCCKASALFDGVTPGTGWILAAVSASIVSNGGVKEYPDAATRAIPTGLGTAVVDAGSSLATGELRQIVAFTSGNTALTCYVSTFNPCKTCPSPQTVTSPGCCPAGQQLVSTTCCPTASVVTSNGVSTCCPNPGGPWVVCPTGATGCTAATVPSSASCCLASAWVASLNQCCPSGTTKKEFPVGSGQYVCCANANILANGQCCPPPNAIVDGQCCPNTPINFGGTNHCCVTCNTASTQCSSVNPAPTGTTYTWMNNQFCCENTLLNAGQCCPACVLTNGASPVTVINEMRKSADCGRGNLNCCPSNLKLSSTSNAADTYCCPADGDVGYFVSGGFTGTPYTSGSWAVTATDESGQKRCCPDSNIKCDSSAHTQPDSGAISSTCCRDQTDKCTSSNQRCCPAAEAVLYAAGQHGCCVNTKVSRGCDGSYTTLMTTCTYLGEGNCCPNGAITTHPTNGQQYCCFGGAGSSWVWVLASPSSGTSEQRCCPVANVAKDSGGAAVACCPAAVTNYTPAKNPSDGSINYCCPTAQVVAGNSNSYCCPSGGPFTIVTGTNPAVSCCATNRVPVQPGTNTQILNVGCCPNGAPSGQQNYWINGACCFSGAAVQDQSGNWQCCSGVNSPQWVAGQCCATANVLDLNNVPTKCCPNTVPANAQICTAFPPPPTGSPVCYVYNGAPAPGGSWQLKDQNGNLVTSCCPADRISYDTRTTASVSTQYFCCPSTSFTWTINAVCCAPANVPTTWDGVARFSPNTGYPNGRALIPIGSKFCCPSAIITTSTYTQTFAKQSNKYDVDCCPLLQVNIDPHTSAPVITSDSMCCDAAQSFLVDQKATALASSYKYCCPSNQMLTVSGTYYCCENALRGGEIWFTSTSGSTSSSGCCLNANIITNPTTTTEKVCCPSSGYWWTDTAPNSNWPGGVAHCCDARFALPTTVPTLANSYCCPTNTPNAPAAGIPGSQGNPSTTPWQVYRRVPNSAVTGAGWNSVAYQCCDPINKQNNTVLDGAGTAVNICCPGPNLTYIIGDSSHAPNCCPYSTIKWDGLTGDLTKASCCPAGSPITAISQSSNRVTCCPTVQFNGVDTCCDRTPVPAVPLPTLGNPCCNASDRLDVSGFPWNLTGQYICCPKIAGKPNPFVNPDTSFNPPACCYGYATTQPPTACCSSSTDFATTDDACCDTLARPDGTCCPNVQWIPGAGGAPKSGTCCPDTDVIVTSTGGSTTCCPRQYADVSGTICCLPQNNQVLDDAGNCCATDVINTDPITGQRFCCGPSQRDDFGVCCSSAQTIHTGAVVNGVANATVRICCANNTVDCAGICYWKDPLNSADVLVPLDTVDANGVCCSDAVRDCAGLCPGPNGLPINNFNATFGDCCPDSARDCLGVCGGRDRNCCENPATSSDCGTCIAKTGCGWCSSPFSSSGSCFSGNHFGPYTDLSGVSPCDAGNRWVINPPSEIISQSGTFADGWKMQYKNYTVTLSPNQPLNVNFTVRVPANVPLDLYILQDGTASFGLQVAGNPSSLQNFQSVLPNLLNVILTNVTADLKVGFGLFADKPVEPFGYWSGGTLDYLWHNLAPLTTDYNAVKSVVNSLRNSDLQGGDDIPEGTLEALLALGVRVSDVGWRQPTSSFSSNHVVLVVTDAPPHKASLGQPFNPAGPYDLAYWTDPSAPAQLLGSNNNVRLPPAWAPNDLLGTFTSGQCGTRPGAATITPPYAREGICQDYPSTTQTIAALQPQSIAPVFIVAPTNGFQPNNQLYPTDIAFSEWVSFVNEYAAAQGVAAGQFGLVANLTGVGTAAGAQALEQAILNALFQVTQTIALRVTNGSEWVTSVSPSQYSSAVPGQDYTFTVTLFWNGTWPGSEGPHPVDVLSLFPKTDFPIEPGHIDIYLAKTSYCGYCGDGIVQPEINEQCEPGDVASADLPCCNAFCQFERTLCNGLARCSPSVCDITDGRCKDEPVTCTPIIDPVQSLCSSNSCINGQCVVSCFGLNDSNPCCDDGDNCTRDTCVSGVCRHDFELPCDCGGNPAYNSCFACIAVSDTSCGWDLATGTCVNINITDLLLNPEKYGIDPNNASVVVYEQDVADKRCVAARSPSSKVGIIVGVIAGAAAAAALIALAAVFGGRIREIAQRIFGSTSASGSAANKVLDNPAYEVAIEQNSALYGSGNK